MFIFRHSPPGDPYTSSVGVKFLDLISQKSRYKNFSAYELFSLWTFQPMNFSAYLECINSIK